LLAARTLVDMKVSRRFHDVAAAARALASPAVPA
jgi:hypothetical protein